MSIHSDLTTLREIVKDASLFIVPIYQRLYVWGDDQVKTLLADLLAALPRKQRHLLSWKHPCCRAEWERRR